MQLAGSKDGGWGYTDRHPGSKMEIRVITLSERFQPRLLTCLRDLTLCRVVVCCSMMVVLLLGCGPRRVRTPEQPATAPLPAPPDLAPQSADLSQTLPSSAANSDADYVELRTGWRLCIVTPLLKSGGYQVKVADEQVSGNTIRFSAGEDLRGYETVFYSVRPEGTGGGRLEFTSAEVTKNGEKVQQPGPHAPLFLLPPNMRFVRLIWTKRVSQADHNMAVVAADEPSALDILTHEVQMGQSTCKSDAHSFCFWVPTGIAVRPEVRRTAGGAEYWAPAR